MSTPLRSRSVGGLRHACAGSVAGTVLGALLTLAAAAGPDPSREAVGTECMASGDSAWADGDHAAAARAYRQALAADSTAVRALHRLALMASWDGRLDTALALVRRARAADSTDVSLKLTEARILSWDNQLSAAAAIYDRLVAESPGDREAAIGRARTLGWAGRLDEAEAAYASLIADAPNDLEALAGRAQIAAWRGDTRRAIRIYDALLQVDPDNLTALVGVSRIHLGQGRSRLARAEIGRAIALDPNHREAREVERRIAASLRPQVDAAIGWGEDSDRNSNWWQSVKSSMWLGPGVRGFVSAGVLQAFDPARRASRQSEEVGVGWAVGAIELTGGLGARQLRTGGAETRLLGTYRGTATVRVVRPLAVGLGFSHAPLDETALLIGRGLDLDALDVNLEARLGERLTVSGGGGGGGVSDGNRRTSALLSVDRTIGRDLSVGVLARGLAFDRRGSGYFSPDLFTVFEVRARRAIAFASWTGALRAGVGRQQVGRDAAGQFEWQLDGRLGRSWKTLNRFEAFAQFSTSALNSTTGAYRYRSAGVSLTFGL